MNKLYEGFAAPLVVNVSAAVIGYITGKASYQQPEAPAPKQSILQIKTNL